MSKIKKFSRIILGIVILIFINAKSVFADVLSPYPAELEIYDWLSPVIVWCVGITMTVVAIIVVVIYFAKNKKTTTNQMNQNQNQQNNIQK